MSSSFTGPIRVYKYNNPTNNGVIAPDNTGAARISQQQFFAPITTTNAGGQLPTFDLGTTTAVPFVIPAGCIIEAIKLYQTAAPSVLTGGVITVSIEITDPVTGNVTTTPFGALTPTTSGGVYTLAAPSSAAVTAIWANIGPLDATITFTASAISAITGTLAGTFTVEYTARNADGSIIPQGSGYTNN